MATPWWAKISPDYYKRPSGLGAAGMRRAREMAAIVADTRLRDQPQVAAAFLNANVPFTVAQRADINTRIAKAEAEQRTLEGAKIPDQAGVRTRRILDSRRKEFQLTALQNYLRDEASGNWLTGAWDFTQEGTKNSVAGLSKFLTAVYSPLMVPAAVFRANENQADYLAGQVAGKAVADTLYKNDPLAGEGAPPDIFTPIIKGAIEIGAAPAIGAARYLGAVPLTQSQQEDMRKQGYNPDDFFSRYAWYYAAHEAGQRAVADSDVSYFTKEYGAESTQAVREILTSNALNDGKFDALSPNAQMFMQKVQGGDQRANELFERMAKSQTLHIGSTIADAFQMERGTTSAAVVSVLGDLAAYWLADPLVIGTKAVGFGRALHRSIPAGDIAAGEAKLLALNNPGVVGSGPKTYAGKAMDELIELADYMNIAQAAKGLSKQDAIALERIMVNKIDKFRIRHPDMMNQLGTVSQLLAGKLDFVWIKSQDQIAHEIGKVAKGEKVSPYLEIRPTQPGPARTLVRDVHGKASQESLDLARADIVRRMGLYLWGEAIATGRPIVKGRFLLPGEVAVNRAVRGAVAPYRNALLGRSTIRKAWDDTNGLVVNFNGDFAKATDQFIGGRAGEFVQREHTTKWGPTFEKMVANFDMSFSHKHLSWYGGEGVETFRRFAVKYFPRHMAYIAVMKFASGGPAERKALWEQFAEGMAQAANFRNTPVASAVYDVLTKGTAPRILHPGQAGRSGPNEVYVSDAADNVIRTGDDMQAAGVWGYQMSDGVTLPSMRLINAYQKRVGLLSAVTGFFNSRLLSAPTSAWKVGKVGNPANMFRQVAELHAMAVGEQGLKFLKEIRLARRYVRAQNLSAKSKAYIEAKGATRIVNNARQRDIRRLEDLARTGDWANYRATLAQFARNVGAGDREALALANLADGVKFEDLARSGVGGQAGLAFAGSIDWLRRIRVEWLRRTGGKTPIRPEWEAFVDQQLAADILRSGLDDVGTAADQALQLGSSMRAADEMAAAAARSIGSRPANVPNSWDWLGAHGDAGAQNWFREVDNRMTDLAGGGDVMRAVAIEARQTGTASAAQVLNQGFNMQRRGATTVYPPNVNTAQEIAEYLIRTAPEGQILRDNAMRLFYDETGARVTTAQQWDAAVSRMAEVQVRDAARHLGARGFDQSGKPIWQYGYYNAVLDKIARGYHLKIDDLAQIPNHARPQSIATQIYVPRLKEPSKEHIANLAGKLYAFTVARPLQRLGVNPVFLANRGIAYRELAPAGEQLMNRGLSAEQAAAFLELQATKYAVNATFRYTDNTFERSFFSELTDNFLMFQRAAEDFMRRFLKVTSANPAILSKAYLLMEAAQHSGVVYPNTETDDEGNRETRLVFTFPGSGLMAQAVAEAGRALGMGDTDLIKTALYSSMSSQLRFINPSLSNPFGFSTTPLIGLPLRIIRERFPETDRAITATLARIEGGGEEFFAEQNVIQSLLPTPLARLVPALTQDTVDGQLSSAVRNAMVYFTAAGALPGPDATADEIEEANDAVTAMATNQLVWRAIIGSFSPWSPTYNEPEGLGLPEVNAIDRAQGFNSIRSEWFELLKQQSDKHGGYDGFAHAMVEWINRHPYGAAIVNPDAFTVGTTRAPGTAEESGSFSSGVGLTNWIVENKDWIEENRAVAYYLLPQFSEPNFSSASWRFQLRAGLREHKTASEFYRDLRQRVGEREWWDRYKQRNAELAMGGRPDSAIYRDFSEWERGWRAIHPATAAEMDRKQDPNYVHGSVAPALERVATSGHAPAGVDMDLVRQVWDHYREYRDKYNKTKVGDKGLYDRRALNKKYRDDGDSLFLNTPVEELWKAIDVYEGD